MLGKLLKYELKRSARKFFPLVVGYMIVALIFSLMLRYGESVKSPNFLMIFIKNIWNRPCFFYLRVMRGLC